MTKVEQVQLATSIHEALAEIHKSKKAPYPQLIEILAGEKMIEEYIILCLGYPVRQLIWGAIALGWQLAQKVEQAPRIIN